MKRLFLIMVALLLTVTSSADNLQNNTDTLRLERPCIDSCKWKPDFDFFKQKTNPGTKPYRFIDDVTFVGIPLFFGGLTLKNDKEMFRVNLKEEQGGKKNTQLLSDFKTNIDDYTQIFGPVAVLGLKLAGYEGRSDWPRLLASAGLSYGLMFGIVRSLKSASKEMRPDGSTANSWPSGHTATAFVGATILHKEYGLTRSPWWSVAGYGVATATGVMRVLNNRHWVSDVIPGAGLGILSTELGYGIADILFKGRGLLRNDIETDGEYPLFYGLSVGVGFGNKDITFADADGNDRPVRFHAATVVDAEGAYFFNKYVGIGGRLRVRAMSAKDFGRFSQLLPNEDRQAWSSLQSLYAKYRPEDFSLFPAKEYAPAFLSRQGYNVGSETAWNENAPVTNIYGTIKSNHLTEFTPSIGLYINIPLGRRFSLGTKALIGRSLMQELDIDGHAEGNKKDIGYSLAIDNTPEMQQDGNKPAIYLESLEYATNTGEKWSDDWEYLTVGGNSSTAYGTGISLTYKYKSNFSWRISCDYDYTRKEFTMRYDPYHFMKAGLTPGALVLMDIAATYGNACKLDAKEYRTTKSMNYITLGLSFLVNI